MVAMEKKDNVVGASVLNEDDDFFAEDSSIHISPKIISNNNTSITISKNTVSHETQKIQNESRHSDEFGVGDVRQCADNPLIKKRGRPRRTDLSPIHESFASSSRSWNFALVYTSMDGGGIGIIGEGHSIIVERSLSQGLLASFCAEGFLFNL